MPITKLIPIRDLNLDLGNFRTVKQQSEKRALHAMVAINPDWFWALMESLIDEGYHPTENILVLKSGPGGNGLTVKEGNRRVAALKLAHGDLRTTNLAIPANIQEKIKSLSTKWKTDNASVPCAIYDAADSGIVDRIIALTSMTRVGLSTRSGVQFSQNHTNSAVRLQSPPLPSTSGDDNAK